MGNEYQDITRNPYSPLEESALNRELFGNELVFIELSESVVGSDCGRGCASTERACVRRERRGGGGGRMMKCVYKHN